MMFWFGPEIPVSALDVLLGGQAVALVNDREVCSAVFREMPGNLLMSEPLMFEIGCPIKGGDKVLGQLRFGESACSFPNGLTIHASVTISGEIELLEPGEGGCS
jgi:hypothetical protein